MKNWATLLAAAIVACACSRPDPSADRTHDVASAVQAGESPATAAVPIAETPAAGAAPARGIEHYFQAQALSQIQRRSQPAPAPAVAAIADAAKAAADAEQCRHAGEPEAARVVDLDADGRDEALAFYAVSGCGAGSVMRVMAVLREAVPGQWAPVLEVAMSVRPGETRHVLDIGNGTITLSGIDDGEGGTMAPEVIRVPPATVPDTPR